ncbi:lactate racemase domain-containing protein [Tautonia plasticadhaerens]|uniref:LarA-like N-terminal domain-containing protein n=1 Tax=Tautonia plasticadhaerens TaxID=2527974 RepID=A0A518GV18_9BACT|nr:lactate racemase domain-containing protein [Tautonia plasticadhaerens]QDV32435.1 hypothetical protein ElP_02670 [Tautonia plasticadhaerens]
MRVAVGFQDDRLEFEVPDDRLVGSWDGPEPLPAEAFRDRLRLALEGPIGYPPLRQNVVPGDRVVIPIDPDVPDAPRVVTMIARELQDAGVGSIRALSLGPMPGPIRDDWPSAAPLSVHEPEGADPTTFAYLASTQQGRRIYLNRELTEADVVVPVGALGFDPVLGYKGPWSTLFPGMSNAETRQGECSSPAGVGTRGRVLEESGEVSWLLGSLFHVGVLPGSSGASGVIAGEAGAIREEGIRAIDRAWTFRPEGRADLVVAGIGSPGRPGSMDDLAAGLATAAGLVRRGGKVVVLSRVGGPLGPALRRLTGLDDPSRGGVKALRGAEAEPDYLAARSIAEALAWADVFLLSDLDEDTVDDLSMIALGSAEEARRLASKSPSCLVVNRAERTKADAGDE